MARSTTLFGIAGAVAIGSAFTILSSLGKRSLLTVVASGIALLVFASTRHIQLLSRRSPKRNARLQVNASSQAVRRPPMDYNLFVLGSGGHTKEMLMMMDDGSHDFTNFHRRYLISSGDAMSENHLEEYEDGLKTLCKSHKSSPGTYDKRIVTRARKVHQPLWSTPLTALLSILDIFPALLVPPDSEAGKKLRYPSRVFSNGPATGFFVALAIHLLKMFYLAPESSMKVVYIESWARISTLSLTGKLLLHTGIADVFVVQHEEVALRYGVQNAGEIVFNSRRLDDIEPSPVKC
ncbi:glycosyltransferase family 1 protein [Trichoderma atroviride IMI 206040]|uniref:UDP-N-acetylglucosamine transferase subunit ALG14 n=1 Tax=Hypocrea atroviridis (strain ATCC 20476 / IMI 206040) TaxID=452589 RepID=G9NLR6_HYPAI|nr:glycosyltransferase family 1 protein [Trichoderma atroviride IMI 206040]EHK48826.1 glycosyltransferase family 1 protein [Trichoderma atroviride IMI 206040]